MARGRCPGVHPTTIYISNRSPRRHHVALGFEERPKHVWSSMLKGISFRGHKKHVRGFLGEIEGLLVGVFRSMMGGGEWGGGLCNRQGPVMMWALLVLTG